MRFKRVLLDTMARDSMKSNAKPDLGQGLKTMNIDQYEDRATNREP